MTRPQVNIAIVVNVIGALSARTLTDGNMIMMDDGDLGSTGQGSVELHTACRPGQVVTWEVVALDVQTPVQINAITFLGPDGEPAGELEPNAGLSVWSGILPITATPGEVYPYRIELRMSEGDFSVLHVDTPALAIAGSC
jgi:hypothetical protein